MSETPSRRTSLYDEHKNLGGRLVSFAGWELPVRYSEVIAEHEAVRNAAGLFDVSHMGEALVTGAGAEEFLNYLTCNDLSSIVDGQAQYTAFTTENGGIIDDIIIYRYSQDKFLVCLNASNAAKDIAWLNSQSSTYDVTVEDCCDQYAQIALQGSKAEEIYAAASGDQSISELKFFHFKEGEIAGVPVIIARTGYTGEDGFEFFVPWDSAPQVWRKILEAGTPLGLLPCGLGARDSLRLEACLPLHGHELSEEITAVESGLKRFIKVEQGDFIGKPIISQQVADGPPRKLVGFGVDDPGIVRDGAAILDPETEEEIGYVTSGTKSPTLGKAIGLALVKSGSTGIDKKILASVRGRQLACHVVKRPFYRRSQ